MIITPSLREVAELEIDEFDRLKQDFKARYGIGNPRPTNVTLRERIAALIKDIQQFDSYLEDNDDLTITARYVEQTGDECCISNDKLLKFEEQVLDKLLKRMSRYDATSLHLHLMREAMGAKQSVKLSSPGLDTVTIDDDFEVVEDGLETLWERFEIETFTAKDIDVDALEAYLTGLMEGNGALASLTRLRGNMRQYGKDLLHGDVDIEESELEWCMMDLLKNDLISDEKKKTLGSYIQNQVAVKELLGVLNMRSIRDWHWKHSGKGSSVTARQDNEGQYHITVEEDLVDMLFLHCTAIGWAQKLKECLSNFFRYVDLGGERRLSSNDYKEREFFLDTMPFEPPGEQGSDLSVCCPPAPPPPLGPLAIPQGVYALPARSKTKKKKRSPKAYTDPMVMLPPPPPPLQPYIMTMSPPPPPPVVVMSPSPIYLDTLDEERHRIYKRDFFMSRLPTQDGCRPKVTPTEEVQANLIKTLAAEIKLRKALDGQYGCTVVNFHSLATALPHKSVLVVLKFLGVPEAIVDFFARFLGANLNIGPSVRGTRDRIFTRTCGVPERHGLELLFTEAVMFFAELAVSKRTGVHLYRLGARCYFVGTEEQNDQAMQELTTFSKHTKLDFDDVLTQPEQLDIGFLELTGDAITIKDSLVEAYALHAKKQLSEQTTVYEWVRIWNSTVGIYVSHLFGPLVDLFGKLHLEAVKAAYKRILDIIFEDSNLTDHVKGMLRARSDFARTSSPLALEAIVYLPQSFGGLGVKNPLVALNLARNITSDPNAIVQEYLDVETKYYEAALNNWSALKPEHISKKLNHIFQSNAEATTAALDTAAVDCTFMTKNSLSKHREYALFPHLPLTLLHDTIPPPPQYTRIPYLTGLHQALLNEPVDNITASERVHDKVRECGPMKRWGQLDPQDKWVLQMYGDECFERYGTLNIWHERFVPKFCMMLVRETDPYSLDDDSTSYTSAS